MEESNLTPVTDLSFVGLLRRLEHIDQLKSDVKSPSAEQVATIEAEASVKKLVQEQLQALSSSKMTKDEKTAAKKFLDAQLKAVAIDAHAQGADKRKAKLSDLQAAVMSVDTADDPVHIVKARAEVPRAEKGYADVHKQYEKWEKGKQLLSVDELKVLKRSHEEGQARLEAAKEFIETQLERRPEAAAPLPSVLAAKSTASAPRPAKAAAKSSSSSSNVRGGGPATRITGTSGYGGGPGGRPPGAPVGGYPSTAAFLQAEAAAAMRQEAVEREAQEARAREAPPKEPREKKQSTKPKAAEEGPVLSYACTVTAVSELLGVREDDARQMAGSSQDFRQHFDAGTWNLIQERSLAIETEKRDAAREKEKHKAAAALARATDKLPMPAGVQAAPKPKPAAKASGGGSSAASRAGAPEGKSKAKAKAQGAPKKNGASLATKNAFAGLSDSDEDDDGWTTVKK